MTESCKMEQWSPLGVVGHAANDSRPRSPEQPRAGRSAAYLPVPQPAFATHPSLCGPRHPIYFPPLTSSPSFYSNTIHPYSTAAAHTGAYVAPHPALSFDYGPRSAPLPLEMPADYVPRLVHHNAQGDAGRLRHAPKRSFSLSPTAAAAVALDGLAHPVINQPPHSPPVEPVDPNTTHVLEAQSPVEEEPPTDDQLDRDQPYLMTHNGVLVASPSLQEEHQRAILSSAPGSPFVSKLVHLLSCEKYRPYIRWNNTGDAFILSHTNTHFASEILPMLFRHSNTSSFIRQLNMYGFQRLPIIRVLEMIDDASSFESKVSTSCFSAFSHQHLRRDCPELAKLIKPKVTRSHGNRKSAATGRKSRVISRQFEPYQPPARPPARAASVPFATTTHELPQQTSRVRTSRNHHHHPSTARGEESDPDWTPDDE